MQTDSIELDYGQSSNDSVIDNEHIQVVRSSSNRVDVINHIDDFLNLRAQWNEINDHSVNGNLFVSWEWLYTWWETYQKQGARSLYILRCTDDAGELLGIAPFQLVNNPKKYFPCSRQLIMLGTGETDGSSVFGEYMDLIIKNGHENTVINEFSDYLEQHNKLYDGLKFQQQLVGSHLAHLFKNKTAHTNESAINDSLVNENITKQVTEDGFRTYIELPESYKEYLMSLRKKMRNNITRVYSRLEAEQSFTIESLTTETESKAEQQGQDGGIEILAQLNRTRRGSMDKNSVFSKPNFELFHSRLLKRLLPLKKVSLQVMSFGDEPVAALYSFVDRDIVHAYQSGFETENGHRYSLLTTMLTQEISNSIENPDISRFNFMYSDDENSYKKRYSGNTERMYNISYEKKGLKNSLYAYIHGPLKSAVKRQLKIS